MRKPKSIVRHIRRAVALAVTGGMVLQLGNCNIADIDVGSSVTINGRDALISIIRGAILTPIDDFITNGVNELVGGNDD